MNYLPLGKLRILAFFVIPYMAEPWFYLFKKSKLERIGCSDCLDLVSSNLMDRLHLSVFEQKSPVDFKKAQLELFLNELDDETNSEDEIEETVVHSQITNQDSSPEVDYDIGSSISTREAPPNVQELKESMPSPLETIHDDEESVNLSSVIRNRNEQYERGDRNIDAFNFRVVPKSAIYAKNPTSQNQMHYNPVNVQDLPQQTDSGSMVGSGLALSVAEKPAPMPKPKPSTDALKMTPNNQGKINFIWKMDLRIIYKLYYN